MSESAEFCSEQIPDEWLAQRELDAATDRASWNKKDQVELKIQEQTKRLGLQILKPTLEDWSYKAACRGGDPKIFFPDSLADTEAAEAICKGCPVQVPCGEFAVQNGEKYGVWGGKLRENKPKPRR